jgi:hypothetical protein
MRYYNKDKKWSARTLHDRVCWQLFNKTPLFVGVEVEMQGIDGRNQEEQGL